MTDRRSFLRVAATALAAARVDAFAQPAGRQYRVGVLRPTGVPKKPDPLQTEVLFPQMLGEMGFHAVFVGTGAGYPSFMGIPGKSLNGVL